ncbi:shikimate kinase [Lentibacillus amyloliquefaciens]|uniref:Shikimate kinase n=1 Tax=Lentibacillus amyloliquefaciens TaxID=1472767 RepID=A0A0U4FQE7_9BACI|nr:shikimate kinase [Lentibacillus amyloliquefaciens]ALX48069.1 hypothetical protein AOX59_05285 [Lentibacillus amyloliquefaciens]
MKTLYLIGFMGSGKSTVGQLLHHDTGASYLDTDQMVVEKYGEIAAIFQREGELQFRHYETDVLKQVPEKDYIVSTGGGIVERKENMAFLKDRGFVIYLDTSFAEITQRLGNDTSRPLWGKAEPDKKELYQRRRERYLEVADMTIATDGKTPQEITAEILHRLD